MLRTRRSWNITKRKKKKNSKMKFATMPCTFTRNEHRCHFCCWKLKSEHRQKNILSLWFDWFIFKLHIFDVYSFSSPSPSPFLFSSLRHKNGFLHMKEAKKRKWNLKTHVELNSIVDRTIYAKSARVRTRFLVFSLLFLIAGGIHHLNLFIWW